MNDETFMALVDACTSGEATPEQWQALEEELRNHPARRDEYLAQASVSEALRALHDQSAAERVRDSVLAGIQSASPSDLSRRVMGELHGTPVRPARTGPISGSRAWWRPVLAIAALVAVFAGIAAWWIRLPPEILVAEANGAITITSDGKTRAARSGIRLHPGDFVNVPTGASARLAVPNEAIRLDIGAQSALAVRYQPRALTFFLERGALDARIEHRERRLSLAFATPGSSEVILGTEFHLASAGTVSRLEVIHGRVSFTNLKSGETKEVATEEAVVASPEAALDILPLGPLARDQWTLTASDNRDKVAKALDTDSHSGWQTPGNQMPGQWIEIDLAEPEEISKITLHSRYGEFPRALRVNGSLDGERWGPVLAAKPGETVTEILFPRQRLRFLRFELDALANAPWSVTDVQVFH